MTEEEVEQAIQDKGLTAPRLTPTQIDEQIKNKEFWRVPNTTTTVCALTLQNNFVIIGKSASVSFKNFDQELGEEIAFNDAREQIWQYAGYALRNELYNLGKN